MEVESIENTFESFCKRNEITLNATWVSHRPGRDSDWDKIAVHFHCVLKIGDRVLWSGFYSQGPGIAEAWARKNITRFPMSVGSHFRMWDALKNPLPHGKKYRDDSPYWTTLREVYGKAVESQDRKKVRGKLVTILPAHDVLLSLSMDIAGCDQPFPDWADELGYSDDSIEAKRIWEACNETRRQVKNALPPDLYAEFEGLEE